MCGCFFPLRAQLKPCCQALRSWPSRWHPQTTCSAWPTWPESWWGCASAAWAMGTSTHRSSSASSCGRSTTASLTSGTRAHTRCPRSCTRCDRAWGKWRTPATPCASVAQKSQNTCWLTCSPVGPLSSTLRKEWFESCSFLFQHYVLFGVIVCSIFAPVGWSSVFSIQFDRCLMSRNMLYVIIPIKTAL